MTSLFDQAFTACQKTIPLTLVDQKQLKKHESVWTKASAFKAIPGQICLIPSKTGTLKEVLAGVNTQDIWALASLPQTLPKGNYTLNATVKGDKLDTLLLGWALGFYDFAELKQKSSFQAEAKLFFPKNANKDRVKALLDSITTIRDLINLPADRLTPLALADRAKKIASTYGATCSITKDQKKLAKEFPLVYGVGKSSANPPCFIELSWGKKSYPKLALVGKGVTFDTGGLNIKPGAAMGLMKKDMGGAAHALGLAQAIMALKLPVHLCVYVPTAENSISGTAMRPQDVMISRKGISVEIDNTDAEGRLLLADALTKACEEKPDYLIDFSTLTGAARVALGPDLPVLMSNNQHMADKLLKISASLDEPFWQLPLHPAYKEYNMGKVADLTNSARTPFAGAITAGLFLQEFIDQNIPWAHFDLYGWNPSPKPGRPEGGEAFGIRSFISFIENLTKS